MSTDTAPTETRPTHRHPAESDGPIVLFDGVCNLCNGFVQFVLRHERDREPRLRFAALQSTVGSELLTAHGLDPASLDSVVLIEGGTARTCSDAVLGVLRHLRAPWRLARIFGVLPRFVRDAGYRVVARSRYRLFGKKDACPMPTAELRTRFLGP